MSTPARASFRAIGAVHEVVVTQADDLAPAVAIALAYLAELDRAASRFRLDSEVVALAQQARDRRTTAFVSEILEDHLRAAKHAARLTGGLVDPTVGRALVAEGYDADLDVVRSRTGRVGPTPGLPGWRTIELHGGQVTLAAGILLDLGATAKAHAADRIADRIAARVLAERGGGVLVNLGGDIATAGAPPAGGWRIGVEGPDGSVDQVVTGTGQAITTSSTCRRSWQTDRGRRHHVIDPRTGRSASTPWAQVTCAGRSALEANAASTAAIVLGDHAPAWLERHRVPARLDHLDGEVTTTAGWPDPAGPGTPRATARNAARTAARVAA